MKEIKYRAWDKNNRVMIYSDDNPKDEFAFIVENEGLQFYYIDTDRHLMDTYSILMQYTGLKDKNGTEIYEGDIIEFYHEDNNKETAERSPVEWFGREKWNYPAFDLHDLYILDHYFEGNALSEIISTGNYHYEIIGNIYENPELLKEE